ncbi:MAG: hypothetical protein PHY45_06740 [Rhodocyclaceae bacterium]|nr:hypothetical protein [Rhodocyclaceae bacterium]
MMNRLVKNLGATDGWTDDQEDPDAAYGTCQYIPKPNRQDPSDEQYVLVGACHGVVVLEAGEVAEYLRGIRACCIFMFCVLVMVFALSIEAGWLHFHLPYRLS